MAGTDDRSCAFFQTSCWLLRQQLSIAHGVIPATEEALLRLVPLGGLGHIGGNMMVYETARDLIVVDCGVLFPNSDQPGVDYIIPDVSYVRERRHKLRAYVITHGHEDHIGALPFVLGELPAPLYATAFTADLLRGKLEEHPRIKYDLRLILDRQPFKVGEFEIDPIPVTHSIPHAVALALKTPEVRVLHTGDFKLDPTPLDGRTSDLAGLKMHGDAGIDLLCSDSTNAERPGRTWSEHDIAASLQDVVRETPDRLFITTFASHIERIQAILQAAAANGRRVIPIGRSMQQNVAMGLEVGYLRAAASTVAEVEDFATLPRNKVIVLASGSQGEPRSAMGRLADGRLTGVRIDPGDRVVLSSRRIPGNERAIGNLINHFYRQGAEVITDHQARVHSSGHAFSDEQRDMLRLCRPKFFVPLHGELRQMLRHGAIAEEEGVAPDNVLVTEDGAPLELIRDGDGIGMRRAARVEAGLVFVDGKGIGDVGEVVLRDRRMLAESGIIVCVAVYSKGGELLTGPELITRGLVYVDRSSELLERAQNATYEALRGLGRRADEATRADCMRQTLRRFFRRELDRKPMVVPMVLTA